MAIEDFPHLLAALNSLSAILLLIGFNHIRNRQIDKHKKTMLSAVAVSAVFLIFYAIYHLNVGHFAFAGQGIIRYAYFTLLFIHVIMAVINLPMILITLHRALNQRFELHRKIARWTFPIWMFVSVSGVIVYVMAFHLYAPSAMGTS